MFTAETRRTQSIGETPGPGVSPAFAVLSGQPVRYRGAGTAEWSPNLKYDYVLAIVRADFFHDHLTAPETAMTVKQVVWDQEVAEAEVGRLNQLNRDKGARCFWQITRLERAGVR